MHQPKILKQFAKNRLLRHMAITLYLIAVLIPGRILATPPLPFVAEYEARYGGFKARAVRSLEKEDSGIYLMTTHMALKLFGKTLSAIDEQSQVLIEADNGVVLPLAYTFEQSGLGKRSRAISFDWDNSIATALIRQDMRDIPLTGTVTDNLSSYLELHRQLLEGSTDILFDGIDKGELELFHFRVQGEETVETPAGEFAAIRVERIRDPGSDRKTVMWLAKNWDYLLLKLVQEEPGSSRIALTLTEAVMDSLPVSPVPKEAPAESAPDMDADLSN